MRFLRIFSLSSSIAERGSSVNFLASAKVAALSSVIELAETKNADFTGGIVSISALYRTVNLLCKSCLRESLFPYLSLSFTVILSEKDT